MAHEEDSNPSLRFRSEAETSPSITRRPDSDEEALPNLVFMSGPDIGRTVRLTCEETVIGRRSSCDIPVLDTRVSRQHARIRALDIGYVVEDLGSKNGTFLEGEPVTDEGTLSDGSRIRLGTETVIRFQLDDEMGDSFHQDIYDASVRDDLTGVYNRRYLALQLRRLDSAVSKGRTSALLAMFDIDAFKKLNDTYGHQAGDRTLLRLTELASELVAEPTDSLVFRYGGDEFALLFRDHETEQVERRLEELREAFGAETFEHDGDTFSACISIGLASSDASEERNIHQTLQAADRALYEAKYAGGDCIRRAGTAADGNETLVPF